MTALEKMMHRHPLAGLAGAASLYWVWWDSFHEVTRFLPDAPLFFDGTPGIPLPLFSCLMRPIGIVAGAIAVALLVRAGRRPFASPRFQRGLLALEAVLTVAFYLCCAIPSAGFAVGLIHGAISACAVFNLVLFGLLVEPTGMKSTIVVVLSCLGSFALASNFGFSLMAQAAPPWATTLISLGLLAAAALLTGIYARENPAPLRSERTGTPDVHTPPHLVLTLLSYGFVFGVLHTLGGVLASSTLNINLPTFFASLVAGGLLAAMFLRPHSNDEIWSKLRSTVFPLTLLGFLSIPLVPNSDLALIITEAAQLLFDMIFFIACVRLMDLTFVDGRIIFAKGLLWKSLGGTAGIAVSVALRNQAAAMTSEQFSFVSLVITALLCAATLWVGTDRQVRRIWGLRRELTPRQYNDAVLSIRCRTLTTQHGLTPRESEILLAIAQGRRAAEIQEEEHVSINTVRAHIQHIYAKLGVHSIAELRTLLKNTPVNEKEIEV